jgi:hypothetical protein
LRSASTRLHAVRWRCSTRCGEQATASSASDGRWPERDAAESSWSSLQGACQDLVKFVRYQAFRYQFGGESVMPSNYQATVVIASVFFLLFTVL